VSKDVKREVPKLLWPIIYAFLAALRYEVGLLFE